MHGPQKTLAVGDFARELVQIFGLKKKKLGWKLLWNQGSCTIKLPHNYVDEVLIPSLFMKICVSSSSSHFRFLTVFLDRCRSFAFWRIDLPSLCTDNRILRIVSTVSIPCSALLLPIWPQHRGLSGVGQFYRPIWPIGGSLFHADLQAITQQRVLENPVFGAWSIPSPAKEASGQLGGAGFWHRVCFIYGRLSWNNYPSHVHLDVRDKRGHYYRLSKE